MVNGHWWSRCWNDLCFRVIILAEDFMLTGQNFSDYRLNARLFGHSNTNPSEYTPDGLYINPNDKKIYQNTGTLKTPIWTERVSDGGSFVSDILALT